MSGNAQARKYLREIIGGIQLGSHLPESLGWSHEKAAGWRIAMQTVEEHAVRLIGILDREDEREAAEVVSNVIDLAERRRTS